VITFQTQLLDDLRHQVELLHQTPYLDEDRKDGADAQEHQDRQPLDRCAVQGIRVREIGVPAAHVGEMACDGFLLCRFDDLHLLLELIVEPLLELSAAGVTLQRACSAWAGVQDRIRVAGEPTYWAQRDMADDACDAELRMIDQISGERFVSGKIAANKARKIVEITADLPAFHHLFYLGEMLLETILTPVLFQSDFGKYRDRPRKALERKHGLIADYDACGF
jgi:hypothetical protein